jgi:selT/selW/selH-like putative selenoprotein
MFFLGMGFIFMGDSLFKLLGMAQPPAWYNSVKENKMQACMFLWIFNSMATAQLATNAFEVSYDGIQIFSKLEEGRFPHPEELVKSLTMRGVTERTRVLNDNSF